jgi:hypothetical protein
MWRCFHAGLTSQQSVPVEAGLSRRIKDALFEKDQARLRPKLEAALRAVDDRLFEVRSNPPNRRELMELEGAKRTIGFLSKDELQT